ncbi:hypothetical protein D3C85_1703680 [compost metagenome]
MIARLLSSGKEKNILIEKDALRDFLYGKYDNATFDELLNKAAENANTSNPVREGAVA